MRVLNSVVFRKNRKNRYGQPSCDHASPDSYRLISLLSEVSKILEKLVRDKIIEYIEDNDILLPQ